MVDGDLVQLVSGLVQFPVKSLVLSHQLLHFFFPLVHFGQVYVKLLSQVGLSVVLVLDDMLVL